MSVFTVKLNNTAQGTLDVNSAGAQLSTSIQRTVYISGPNGVHRKLNDGDTFTDSNYYKRYAYPQVSLEDAILETTTDDGSVYSDVPAENTFPVVWLPGSSGVLAAGDTYDDTNMALDIAETYGGYATFVQISNYDGSDDCRVRLNGSTSAVLTVQNASTQVFDSGDIAITSIEFDNSTSGASTVNSVQVILGVKSVSNS